MVWWKDDPDIQPPSKEKHNSPRVGDAVYVEGYWREEPVINFKTGKPGLKRTYIKSKLSRVNGMVIWVDHDSGEVTVAFTDHPYADPDEPKKMYLSKDVFYGQWNASRSCFILRDSMLP
jgi:hypothetical protein